MIKISKIEQEISINMAVFLRIEVFLIIFIDECFLQEYVVRMEKIILVVGLRMGQVV